MTGERPPARSCHSANCITDIHLDHHHPVLVVAGGFAGGVSALSDVWLFDLANRQWNKVCFSKAAWHSSRVFLKGLWDGRY